MKVKDEVKMKLNRHESPDLHSPCTIRVLASLKFVVPFEDPWHLKIVWLFVSEAKTDRVEVLSSL